MDNDHLSALCTDWQRRLRLQDWDVTARFVRVHDLGGECRGATVNTNDQQRRAWVEIIDERDWSDPHAVCAYDPEWLLVHELLHLHMEPFMPERKRGQKFVAAEVMLNRVARALVEARRSLPDNGNS